MTEHPSVVNRSNRLLKEALERLLHKIETYQKPAVCIAVDPSMTKTMNAAEKARAREREFWAAVIRDEITSIPLPSPSNINLRG